MIRWYKGIQKVKRLSGKTKLGTALYEILEDGELGKTGELTIFPTRLGWSKTKGND